MKAAVGELNLTLITVIAVGALLGLFWLFYDEIVGLIDFSPAPQPPQTQSSYIYVDENNNI